MTYNITLLLKCNKNNKPTKMFKLYRLSRLLINKSVNNQKRCVSSSSPSTVFALSSGLGKCGVAVIRVSGSHASHALKAIANLKELPLPRTALLRSIKHPVSGEILDQGLVLWFPGPKSFTGEDSCEFHVHGGVAVINGVLDALGSFPSFRLAEAGEFTKRAFLNGKLDLTEVEGLADLLQAETEAQRKQGMDVAATNCLFSKAFLQLHGSLSKLYQMWRQTLLHSVANIEAHIDFEETDTLEYGLIESVMRDMKILAEDLKKHLKDGRRGELLRNGVKTVILGEPNVGKSSLLNLLCQRPASIVTPISGTTRDIIEVTLNIGGYPLVLSDTAGLRNISQDIIEIEGMSRALEIYRKSDLVVLVVDFSSYLTWKNRSRSSNFTDYVKSYTQELGISDLIKTDCKDWKSMFTKNCIVVLNKTDLDETDICSDIDKTIVPLSCKTENGVKELVDVLSQQLKVLCGEPSQEHPSMNQVRHKQQLKKSVERLELFLKEASKKDSADLVIMAEHLRKALGNIGKLIGTVTSEEILDVIFRDFCIGK